MDSVATILIVGLGNPGEEYELTRHNAGFMSVNSLAERLGATAWTDKSKLKAQVAEARVNNGRVILAKPNTFMNESGQAVHALQRFYKAPPTDMIIIYDDKDIAFGAIKTQVGGGSAGHNGVKSLSEAVQSDATRVRIGIKNALVERIDTADFVLARFSRAEQEQLTAEILDAAATSVQAAIAAHTASVT